MSYAVRKTPRTSSSESSDRRPLGTDIVGEIAPNRKGITGPIGSLRVQDLVPAGLISMAFDVSVASCVKKRNQPPANGAGRRLTETAAIPSMPSERERHARGRNGR
jgi:hypothetical protein